MSPLKMYHRYMTDTSVSAKEMALNIIALAKCADINPHHVHRDMQQRIYGTHETVKLFLHDPYTQPEYDGTPESLIQFVTA